MTGEASSISAGQQPGAPSPGNLRRIRVLHVVPSLYGGGMEHLMLEVMRASTPAGGSSESFRVTHGVCILRAADDRLLSQCRSVATTWVLGRRKTRDWSSWKRLRQVIGDFDPDVVEALSTAAWVDAARAVAGRRQTKLVLSYHGQVDTTSAGRLRRWLNRWAARKSAAVITVSREAADRLAGEWGIPAAKLRTLPNGVDVSRFRPPNDNDERVRIRRKLGVPDTSKVAICAANLMPIKAVDVLIEAWRQLPGDQEAMRLLIVGDGPTAGELKATADRLHCDHTVSFLGNRDDVPALLRAADLFVSSSRYEACSIAILEAMSSGLAVVATDVGGNRELVEHGRSGWLVPPDRADLLARAIADALKDDCTRRQAGQHARTVVTQQYNLEACARRYADLFHSTVGSARQRSPGPAEEPRCAE